MLNTAHAVVPINRDEQNFRKALEAPLERRMLFIHPPYANGPVYVIATQSAAIHRRLGGFTPADQGAAVRYFNSITSKENPRGEFEFTPAGATSPCRWTVVRSFDTAGTTTFTLTRR